MTFLNRLQPLGLLFLRLAMGAVMIVHGYAKVFGGMHHFSGVVAGLGLPWWMAYLSAAAEFGGGILVVLGFFTRCASIAILIDMVVAILKVHLKNGFVHEGNYQLPLTLAAVAFALMVFGAGPISIDGALGKSR